MDDGHQHNAGTQPLNQRKMLVIDKVIKDNGRDRKEQLAYGRDHSTHVLESIIIEKDGAAARGYTDKYKETPVLKSHLSKLIEGAGDEYIYQHDDGSKAETEEVGSIKTELPQGPFAEHGGTTKAECGDNGPQCSLKIIGTMIDMGSMKSESKHITGANGDGCPEENRRFICSLRIIRAITMANIG